MKYKWSKLTDGWVHVNGRLCKQVTELAAFYSDDQGDAYWDYTPEGLSPERTLELLAEAVAQRKQCEVREPRFKFGDWVTYRHAPASTRIVTRPKLNRDGRYCYGVLRHDSDAVRGESLLYLYDDVLTPCDPPGDGGGE